jgi:hypothetical protein
MVLTNFVSPVEAAMDARITRAVMKLKGDLTPQPQTAQVENTMELAEAENTLQLRVFDVLEQQRKVRIMRGNDGPYYERLWLNNGRVYIRLWDGERNIDVFLT